MVNRSIRVISGQYNGYKGRVKHETGTHVQLELDAISGRLITVSGWFQAWGRFMQGQFVAALSSLRGTT